MRMVTVSDRLRFSVGEFVRVRGLRAWAIAADQKDPAGTPVGAELGSPADFRRVCQISRASLEISPPVSLHDGPL